MNHIYRVIFNRQTGTFQAVAETAKTPHKTGRTKSAKLFKALLTPISLALSLALGLSAHAAPTGGQVTAGQATINQNGLTTTINQSSQNAAINWQSFNVGKNETVNFNQPNAGSVTLNRVIGNERSVIDGAMNASGKVFISNANGMLIGKDAKINVGSLVATTANISDDDVMNGRYSFTGGQGSIENLGHISVPKGGVVALVAPIVKNGGTIKAHEGNVLLASAESFSITLPDNANFAYTLDKGTLQGLVDNGGAILTDAGRVVLTAKGVDTVKKSLIKHSGNIEANTVQNKNGVIELLGDLDNSALNVSGSLKAEGRGNDKGGFIETSSAELDFDKNAYVSTQSETGQTGTWLIDPKDFTVAQSGGDMTGQQVSDGLKRNNVTLKSRDGAKEGKGDVIINDEINWDKNTLTLNAENDIHINKTMNGSGTAKLALEYGQGTSDGGESDYYLDKNTPLKDRMVKVNLPEGKSFSTKKGSKGETHEFDVIHKMPDIIKNVDGEWESKFTERNIAFGADIDLSFTKNLKNFNGWEASYVHMLGLGHKIKNLTLDVNKPDLEGAKIGLFSHFNGTIKDLYAENIDIKALVNHGYVGGIVGWGANFDNYTGIYSTTLENVHMNGKIRVDAESSTVGGIIARNSDVNIDGMVKNSSADVDISVKSKNGNYIHMGGIAGHSHVKNVTSSGNLNYIGNSDLEDYTGAWGINEIGGLVGYGNVVSSYSDINLNIDFDHPGNIEIGGLVGSGLVNDSYYEGDMNVRIGKSKVGGVWQDSNQQHGEIGGLIGSTAGYNPDAVRSSYFNGNIKVDSHYNSAVGALVGEFLAHYHKIKTSYYNKDKTSLKAVGLATELAKPVDYPLELHKSSDSELKTKSTFKDWDFEKVWYMNKNADGTYSYPMLRAFAQTLTVNPTPTPPTAQTTAGVKAPDLSKTYDGKAVNTVDDLKKLNGWKDNFDADGLTTGDSVESIFKAGTLTIDETRGDWKGAKDVKEGGYELYPTGTLKDEYQQKYIIEWNKGTLTINPAKLTITAMNNIKPEGDNNPDVSRIGVVVTGLVEGESISDVNLSYSDDKKWQGDISIIRVGEPVFKNGKASNYEITKNHGKLLTVQREYDLKNITDKKPEDVAKIRDLLNAVEDEMLLAHAVYGGDSAKKGDADRWYEIWEVKDNATGVTTKELHKLGFDDEPKDSTKTYTKIYELIKDQSVDYSDGVRYQITIKKDWAIDDTKIVTQDEYDELLKTTPQNNITINKTFRDGLYSATEPNGLNMGVYRKVNTNKHFIVFRGTDTKRAVEFGAIWSDEVDSDGGTNIHQARGDLPQQYKKAREITSTLIGENPNNEWTIIGHSLGGGLASYSSIHQTNPVRTITFNQAQIQYKNLPNEYKKIWENYFTQHNNSWRLGDNSDIQNKASNLTVSEMMRKFTNINSFVFDNDALFKARVSTTVYPAGIIPVGLLQNTDVKKLVIDRSEQDHSMPHIIKTQRLANIVAQNNEITANCQKGCVKIQEHQWTPPAQLKEIDTNRPTKYQKERDNIQRDIAERERKGKDTEKQHNNLAKVTQKLEQAEVTSGKITVVRGNDSWEVGKNGFLDFKFGDVISTENKKATIYFPDGSWIELDKNSSIRIEIDTTSKRPMADQISLIKGKILRKGNKKPE